MGYFGDNANLSQNRVEFEAEHGSYLDNQEVLRQKEKTMAYQTGEGLKKQELKVNNEQ